MVARTVNHRNLCELERVAPISDVKHAIFDVMATTRSGPGRPALGERTRMTVRVPSDIYEALRREAKARGISMNQYVAEVAATHLGMPESMPNVDSQEAIPA